MVGVGCTRPDEFECGFGGPGVSIAKVIEHLDSVRTSETDVLVDERGNAVIRGFAFGELVVRSMISNP